MPDRIPVLNSRTPAERNREYDRGRRTTPELAAAKRIRSGRRWQAYRMWLLGLHPLCCNPMALHGDDDTEAEDVHHVEQLQQRLDLAYEPTNTAPLCTGCHAAVTVQERRGKATAHLFAAWRVLAAKIDERTIGFC